MASSNVVRSSRPLTPTNDNATPPSPSAIIRLPTGDTT